MTDNRLDRRAGSPGDAPEEPPPRLRQLLRAAWPVGLLIVFAVMFRSAGSSGRIEGRTGGAGDASCEAASADVAVMERCLTAQPDDIEMMLDLGCAYELAGRNEDAEGLYRRALHVDARDGDVHLRLGRVLLARGDASGAWREGEAALGAQPGSPDAQRLVEDAGRAAP